MHTLTCRIVCILVSSVYIDICETTFCEKLSPFFTQNDLMKNCFPLIIDQLNMIYNISLYMIVYCTLCDEALSDTMETDLYTSADLEIKIWKNVIQLQVSKVFECHQQVVGFPELSDIYTKSDLKTFQKSFYDTYWI